MGISEIRFTPQELTEIASNAFEVAARYGSTKSFKEALADELRHAQKRQLDARILNLSTAWYYATRDFEQTTAPSEAQAKAMHGARHALLAAIKEREAFLAIKP